MGAASDYDYDGVDGVDPPPVRTPSPSVSRPHHSLLSELLGSVYRAQACWRYHALGQMPPRGCLVQLMLYVRSLTRLGQHSGPLSEPRTTGQAVKSESGDGPCVIKRWMKGNCGNWYQHRGRRSNGGVEVKTLWGDC